jgi:hypothetical protein
MKACRGSRRTAPLILSLDTRLRWVVNFTPKPLYPREITPVPNEEEAEWAPQQVWEFWRRLKPLPGFDPRSSSPSCPRYQIALGLRLGWSPFHSAQFAGSVSVASSSTHVSEIIHAVWQSKKRGALQWDWDTLTRWSTQFKNTTGGTFCPMLPKIRKGIALFEGSQTLPTCPCNKSGMRWHSYGAALEEWYWQGQQKYQCHFKYIFCTQTKFVPQSKHIALHYKDTLMLCTIW